MPTQKQSSAHSPKVPKPPERSVTKAPARIGWGNVTALTERLGDNRFAAAQRQSMAAQVGKIAGNQYLQRKLTQRETTSAPVRGQTSLSLQRSWFDDVLDTATGVLDTASQLAHKVWEELAQTVTDAGIKTVISENAQGRTDPPKLKATGELIPVGTKVTIVKTITDGKKKFSLIEDYLPPGMPGAKRQWWTERQHLARTDPLVPPAIEKVKSQNLGREAIEQLQEKLGVTVTGGYDEATAEAVLSYQQAMGLKRTGVADIHLFRRLGLVYTQEITAGSADDALLAEIESRFPQGITIAIYTDYDKTIDSHGQDNRTFRRNAEPFAERQGAVGLDGGKIMMGKAVGIKALGDVVETVQSVHRGLLQQYRQRLTDQGMADDGRVPAFTRVKNLALFAHGEPYGIGLDSTGQIRGQGLSSSGTTRKAANLDSFIKGIAGALNGDVQVQLYACSTGRDIGTEGNWLESHDEAYRAGKNSFAAALAQALGPQSTVFGHTTSGHTSENYASRVFGHQAGGGEGGIHIFNLLYDNAFVSAELQRLFPDHTPEEREAARSALRNMMWDHYKDSISTEHHRLPDREHTVCKKNKQGQEKCITYSPKEYERPLGQEMFVNPANAIALMHQNWQERWVPAHMDTIKKL